MKNIINIYALGLLSATLALSSCSNEDVIGSSITNYAVIELNSPEQDPVVVPVGEVYSEPGAVATVDGSVVDLETSYGPGRFFGENFDPASDSNPIDVYTAEYSAVNTDGFYATVTRDIVVSNTGDLVNSIEGVYRSTVVRNGASAAQYNDMGYVLIWKNEDGTYQLSDAIGGYYDIGRLYGPDYATVGGIIVANDIPSNNFSFEGDLENAGFGGEFTITSLEVHPEDGSIDMVTVWVADPATTYTFDIHLVQVQ